jgi:hypothetical protein
MQPHRAMPPGRAIAKTAASGEIDAPDPGGYGEVTITKSITIDGGGGQIAGVLVSGTNGILVQAATTDIVILRNLSINGLNTGLDGIRIAQARWSASNIVRFPNSMAPPLHSAHRLSRHPCNAERHGDRECLRQQDSKRRQRHRH